MKSNMRFSTDNINRQKSSEGCQIFKLKKSYPGAILGFVVDIKKHIQERKMEPALTCNLQSTCFISLLRILGIKLYLRIR